MAEILSMEQGMKRLRGDDAWAHWRDRLAYTPFIARTLHRAPTLDPRHAAAAAAAPAPIVASAAPEQG